VQSHPEKDLAERLRRLEDREAIAELMSRYAEAVRLGSAEAMADCFSEDASIEYGADVKRGKRELLGYFSQQLESLAEDRLASTPLIGNLTIDLDGDAARCESTVLAIHARRPEGRGVVVVRGTRNDDDVVRTDEGWRIRSRVHSTLWQFEAATPPG